MDNHSKVHRFEPICVLHLGRSLPPRSEAQTQWSCSKALALHIQSHFNWEILIHLSWYMVTTWFWIIWTKKETPTTSRFKALQYTYNVHLSTSFWNPQARKMSISLIFCIIKDCHRKYSAIRCDQHKNSPLKKRNEISKLNRLQIQQKQVLFSE